MADDIPGLPYDGATDVVDLSGNGKGVALSVWPSDNRIPVAEDPIPLDTFVLEMGELAYASTTQRLRVGDGYTAGGDEVAYMADLDAIENAHDILIQAVYDAITGKANITGGNAFVGNQSINGNLAVSLDAYISGLLTANSVEVTDEPYGVAWNGKVSVPTKNAVYDKIVSLGITDISGLTNALAGKAPLVHTHVIADVTNLQTTLDGKANLAGATFVGAITVPDDAYAVGWNASTQVPTKNAVYDKIESVIASILPPPSTIVGITGTLAQFNTALTDDNFAGIGAANVFTASQQISTANPTLTLNPTSGSSGIDIRGTASANDGMRLTAGGAVGYARADTLNVQNRTGAVNYGVFSAAGLAVTGNVSVTDEAYGASWDGSLNVPTKNALYDKIQALGSISISDEPYGATWDGSLAAPSKNAVYDKIQAMSIGGTGVTTFNTRSGAVTLLAADVTSALTFTPANKAGDTFTGAVNVPDLVYGLAWSGSFAVPTRNAVYNQIEALTTVVASKADTSSLANYLPLAGGTVTGELVTNAALSVAATIQLRGTPIIFKDAANVTIWGRVITSATDIYYRFPKHNYQNYNGSTTYMSMDASVAAFTVPATVPDDPYAAGWDANLQVPTKNAVYDKIQAVVAAQGNYLPLTGGTITGVTTFNQNTTFNAQATFAVTARGMSSGTFAAPGQAGFEAYTPNGPTEAAMMAFHRAGALATYAGLDADGSFKIGGWSWGTVFSVSPTVTGLVGNTVNIGNSIAAVSDTQVNMACTNQYNTIQMASYASDGTAGIVDGYMQSARNSGLFLSGNPNVTIRSGSTPIVGVNATGMSVTGTLQTTSNLTVAGTSYIKGTGPTQWWWDTDERTFAIHVNGNNVYFMRGEVNSPSWTNLANGEWPMRIDLGTGTTVVGGPLVANADLIIRGGVPEGGQIVLGWKGQTAIDQGAASTWNIDVTDTNSFRIYRLDAGGAPATVLTVDPVTMNAGFDYPVKIQGSMAFRHYDGAFASANIRYSTAAPSGGNDGDIWLQYT